MLSWTYIGNKTPYILKCNGSETSVHVPEAQS